MEGYVDHSVHNKYSDFRRHTQFTKLRSCIISPVRGNFSIQAFLSYMVVNMSLGRIPPEIDVENNGMLDENSSYITK